MAQSASALPEKGKEAGAQHFTQVGTLATQAAANLNYGEVGLKLLEKGYTAQQTLEALLALDEGREERQVGIVDTQGNAVSFTWNAATPFTTACPTAAT